MDYIFRHQTNQLECPLDEEVCKIYNDKYCRYWKPKYCDSCAGDGYDFLINCGGIDEPQGICNWCGGSGHDKSGKGICLLIEEEN